MIDVNLKCGMNLSLDDDCVNDIEVMDTLVAIDEGKSQYVSKAMRLIIGDVQYKELINHLRGSNGRTKATEMIPIIYEIIEALGKKGKNS